MAADPNHHSSIPFAIEVPSDEENQGLEQQQQQHESPESGSDDGILPEVKRQSKSQRRISQVSMGSDFEGMNGSSHHTTSTIPATAAAPPEVKQFQYTYVMPLAYLNDDSNDDNHDQAAAPAYRSNHYWNQTRKPAPQAGNITGSNSNSPKVAARPRGRSGGSFEDMLLPEPFKMVASAQTSLQVSSLQEAAAGRRSRSKSSESGSGGSDESDLKRKGVYTSSLQRRLTELKAQQSHAEQVLINSRENSLMPPTKNKVLNIDEGVAPPLRRIASRDSSPVPGAPLRRYASMDRASMASFQKCASRDTSAVPPPQRRTMKLDVALQYGMNSASRESSPIPTSRKTGMMGRAISQFGALSDHGKSKHKRTNFSDRLKIAQESNLSSSRHSDILDQSSGQHNSQHSMSRDVLLDISSHNKEEEGIEMEASIHSLRSHECVPDDAPLPVAAATAAINRSRRMRKHADRKKRLHLVLRKMNSTVTPPAKASKLPSQRGKNCASSDDEDDHLELMQKCSPSLLLQPSNEDLEASFQNVGGFLQRHGQEEMERKPSARITHSEFDADAPHRGMQFPSTVPKLGEAAALPTIGFTGTKAVHSLFDEDDEDNQLQDDIIDMKMIAKGYNHDIITQAREHYKMVASVSQETKMEGEAAATGSGHILLCSVSSDVRLDPAQLMQPSNSAMTGGGELSVLHPLDQSLTTMQSETIIVATKASRVKQQGIGSVAEEKPHEAFYREATPFFGATLRQLQTVRKLSGSDPKPLTSDSSSISSFAKDEDSIASTSISPSEAGALAAYNRRGSQLVKIDETLGNASGTFSHNASEELDNFDSAIKVNPIEQKLINQRNGMYSDGRPTRRRDSMLSTTSTNSNSSHVSRRSSASRRSSVTAGRRASLVKVPILRRNDGSFRGDAAAAQDYKFSSGQQDLANIELDHTLPPPVSRASRKEQQRTSIASSVTDSVNIDSAAMAMAAVGGREQRPRRQRKGEQKNSSGTRAGWRASRRSSRVSGGATHREQRDIYESIDLDAFEVFTSGRSSNNDDEIGMKSVASSMFSRESTDDMQPKRLKSMYHSKTRSSAAEDAERNERAWAAMFHGHGIVLENTGERPVLKRLYFFGAAAGVLALCVLIPFILWREQDHNSYEPADPSDSFCANQEVAESLRRCPCNTTASYQWDEKSLSRYEELRDILVEEGVVDVDDLDENFESCDYNNVVIQWLAEDSWGLDSNTELTVQRYVYGLFFLALDGSDWTDWTGWMTELDVCDWLGSSCSRTSRVTRMDLTANNLQGTLPPEMTELTLLTSLRFGENGFTGTMPESLSGLSNLFEIDIARNNVSGNFSALVFSNSSSSLEILMLESNTLQGSIPETLELLTKLEVLILSSNRMDGSLPKELGKLTDLRVLELANNTFTGEIPADLSNLSKLEVLDLTGNNFSGTVPENICLDLVFLEALLVDCFRSLVVDDCPCCVCQSIYS